MRRGHIAGVLWVFCLAACEPVVDAGERQPAGVPRFSASAEATLIFARFAAGAPPTTLDTGFWAVRGKDRILELRHRGGTSRDDALYLRFRVPAGALVARPDGTPIKVGDSLRIRVVIDPRRLIFDFGPNGLRFSPNAPAVMTIFFDDIDPDIDRDGAVDPDDRVLRAKLAIFRQRVRGEPWRPLPTTRPATDVARASIPGFSRFSLASN
jgi:hypothetical protein